MKMEIPDYTIDTANNKVVLTVRVGGIRNISLEELTLILNVTTNEYWYLPVDVALGGTLTKVGDYTYDVVLDKDISEETETDKLQIFLFKVPHTQKHPKITRYDKTYPLGVLGDTTEFDIDVHAVILSQPDHSTAIAVLEYLDAMILVFKATNPDIHGFFPLVSAEYPGTTTSYEDFESYADTAALIAVWSPDSTKLNTTLELTGGPNPTYPKHLSFEISVTSVGKRLLRSESTPVDWSTYDTIRFWHKSSALADNNSIYLKLTDNLGNRADIIIPAGVLLDWHEHIISFSELNLLDGTIDFSIIKHIVIRAETYSSKTTEYIDSIVLQQPTEGAELELSLIDFDTDIKPVATDPLGSTMTLDDGTNIVSRYVPNYKSIVPYDIIYGHAHYGSTNELTINNYYGLLLTNAKSGADITVWGSATKIYTDGGTFPISGSNLGTELDNSLGHNLIGHVKGHIDKVVITFNGDPGEGSLLWLEYIDIADEVLILSPVTRVLTAGQTEVVVDFSDEHIHTSRELGLYGHFQKVSATTATKMSVYTIGRY